MGYNFGCMIASDTLFDSRVGFSWSSYPKKTSPRSCLMVIAMATSVVVVPSGRGPAYSGPMR